MIIGGLLAVLSIGTLLLRWTSIGNPAVVAVVGLTPFLFIPLGLAVAASAVSRNRILSVVVAISTLGYVLTVSPWDAVVGCGRDISAQVDATVLTLNTYLGIADPDAIASLVVEHNPDILVLQETTPALVAQLAADERLAEYTVRSDEVLTDVVGVILWSRHPVDGLRKFETGRRSTPRATIQADTGDFEVTAVHTTAPTNGNFAARWKQHFRDLRAIPTDGRKVLVGDFNATEDHGAFRSLLGEGWTDVHQPKGCGLDATWPSGRRLPFAIYRLDHVLVTDDIEVIGVDVISDNGGSDHRAVVAYLGFGS